MNTTTNRTKYDTMNIALARIIGYSYDANTEELFDTTDALTSIKWMPQHDYNQLHWLESTIKEDGYQIATIGSVYEISIAGQLVIVKDENTAKQSMYLALYELATSKYSQNEN